MSLSEWSKGTFNAIGVGLLVVMMVMLIATVVTLVSAGGWMDFSSVSFLPNARKILGETHVWTAFGLGLLATAGLGVGAAVSFKAAGKKASLNPVDANMGEALLGEN